MSSTGVPLDPELAVGGEHGPSASPQDVKDRTQPDDSTDEYQQLVQTPVSELTASDVSRLTELRAEAATEGNDSRVERIEDKLLEFAEEVDLPVAVFVQSELGGFQTSTLSRGEYAAMRVAGLSCGVSLGFVLAGPEGVLAGAVIGYVLISQFPAQEVSDRDEC